MKPASWRRLADTAAGAVPASFAMVMATGILSIAAFLLGHVWLAKPLIFLNALVYAVLWSLLLLRLRAHPRRLLADAGTHERGPSFLTIVAGSSVLGSQLALVGGVQRPSWILLVLAGSAWVVLVYGFLAAVTVRAPKPSVAAGLNGAWLLLVVATQSLSVLGTQLAPRGAPANDVLLFLTLCLWLVGALLYVVVITLIVYRFTFEPLIANQLTPPYWINMGAVAITTLAGALLLLRAEESALLVSLLPFIRGFTLLFWAVATWWIPLLVLLGFWRHVVCRHPLRYAPEYWGLVFPLGMYATCSFRLSQALDLPFLMMIPRVFVWIASAAWLATSFGLIASLVSRPRRA